MVFSDPPRLRNIPDEHVTERLILRTPRMGDGVMVNEAVHESFTALNQWMPWARNRPSIAESETHIREAAARHRTREELSYLIFKPEGSLCGIISLHHIDWDVPKFELGYWIRTQCSGFGYMTEAVHTLTNWCIRDLSAIRMEIRCDARNYRSSAVALRAGYVLEATLHKDGRTMDGGLRDTQIYVKLTE